MTKENTSNIKKHSNNKTPEGFHEEWKDIKGFEGFYKISNTGIVLSVERKIWNGKGYFTKPQMILKQGHNQKAYPLVYLSKNGEERTIAVHRLVAETFIPNPLNLPQVNHIDGNKENNNVWNLEWCTNLENQRHARANGLYIRPKTAGKPQRPVYQIDMKTNKIMTKHESIAKATEAIGFISKSNIGACCRGLKKSVGGYKWQYADIKKE